MKNLKLSKYFKRIQIKRDVLFNDTTFSKKYRMAVVIPVYGEYDYIGKTLFSLLENHSIYLEKTLIMLVVNNPAEGANSCYVKENQHLLRELNDGSFQKKCRSGVPPLTLGVRAETSLRQGFDGHTKSSVFVCRTTTPGRSNRQITKSPNLLSCLNLVWIDASGSGQELPGKGGVGMARKLGMDSVLEHIDWNDDPIIISLDADTLVEKNYLETIDSFFKENKDISAASVNFKHLSGENPEQEKAIREYEYSIRYYIENLKKAGSPYAYHTIGSAMVCRANAYIRAGGMKLHRGGEDFYFMQALRKLGPIMEITGTTVSQSARPSDRVPFGTGPKVQQCLNGTELKLYNARIFDVLKDSLFKVEKWIKTGNSSNANQFIDSLSEEAENYFRELNFNMIWSKIFINNIKENTNLSEKDREKLLWAFHVWFDAFKTLKFVHYLERKYPKRYSKTDIEN